MVRGSRGDERGTREHICGKGCRGEVMGMRECMYDYEATGGW